MPPQTSKTNMDITMTTLPFSRKALSIAILTTLLAACGGGSSDSGTSNTTPAVTEGTITGTASKGILQKALVTAYKVTADGKKGDKLISAITNNDGTYSLKVSGYSGAVLLEMTSSSDTTMLCDNTAGCGEVAFGQAVSATSLTLQSVLPELKATNKTAITPFTHLASKYAEKNGYNKANIEAALTQIADLFNLPALNETTPVNAAGDLASATATEQQYAVMNAAIAQLAGTVANISTKLNELATEINSKSGQLQSSGAAANKIDLEDVLTAAKNVAESGKLNHLDAGLKTILAAQLATAENSTNNTTATPSSGAGLTDLAKAKAFVNSTSLLLATLQQYDDQSFVDTLENKVLAIKALTNGDQMMPEAVSAATTILATSIEQSQASHTLGKDAINTLLAENFNSPNSLVATASNDLKLIIDAATNTATLTGELKLQRKKWQWNGQQYAVINDGAEQGFTISNFKISYPAKTTSSKDFVVAIDANSKIKTANLEMSFANNSQSRVVIKYDNAATLQSHLDAADTNAELATSHIPARVEAKLDQVTLKVLTAGSGEFNQFVGSLSLSAKKANLDTTTGGKRLWPMPEIATLSGKFSGGAGDMIEATASVDLTGSNPKVSPEEGHTRSNLYNYKYSSGNNTITLKPSVGTIGWNKATQITISMVDCGNGQKRLSANDDSVYFGYNCSTQTNVAEAYKNFINSSYYYYWGLRTFVENEGDYLPSYAANFNYLSSNASVNGILNYSEDMLSEDATHLGKAAITVQTKIKFVGNAAADIDAQITAKYAGQQNGEVTAVLRVGNDKISISSPVAGGKPVITLSNQNGVSIEANVLEQDQKIELKVAGKVQGSVYKLNGLPVAKFIDNSLKAL